MDGIAIAIIGIIAAVALPIAGGIILGFQSRRTRHEERMAMIEKGIILEEPEKKANRYPALRNGLFMVFLALGILIGIFMLPVIPTDSDWAEFSVLTIATLFGGIGFIIYFFLSRYIQVKEKETDRRLDS